MRRLQWYKRGAAYEPLTYFYETLMRLPGTKTEKSHSFYLIIYQVFKSTFLTKNETLRLFLQKKLFT